jgi:serine/threonine protein kinase
MPASPDCPGTECWEALFGDTMSPEERQRYERHLESCAACQERLDRAEECRGGLVGRVRQIGDPTATAPDPTLVEVLGRLHEVKSPVRAAAAEPAELYFLHPAERPNLLGTLGSYEVQEVIGQGGMGVVLKAFEPALHRLVAIKVLAAAVAGSATARKRFTREAQAAAAVCHDHVVAVHGVSESGGLPYLVMQYVPGESLQARLDRCGPLEVTEVVRIGLQTAQGLAAAHAQGLIHRDIKPANLLLENGLAKVKITDFGLARTADDVGLTRDGVVAGTPEYMAPEQARGEPVDHRADLFSLGSVLYAACTGVPPFQGATAVAVLRQVSDAEPVPPRTLNAEVPAWLEGVIMRLLAKNPAERFQSAAEVAALLEGYLSHLRQPVTVPVPLLPPPPPGYRPARPTRPSSDWAGRFLGLAALVAILTTLGLLRWFLAGGEPPAQKAPRGEFHYDFRHSQPLPPSLAWAGRDGDEMIEPEDKGLRITLSAKRQRTDPVGPVMVAPVTGDFEITTGFEIVRADTPRTGYGVGYELYVMTDAPTQDAIAFARVKLPDGRDEYACTRMTTPVNEKRKYQFDHVPTTSTSGRLRLTRRGTAVTFWAAEGEAGEFKELCRREFGAMDLSLVRMGAYPGHAPEAADVRIVDVRIRSDAPLPDQDFVTASAADGKSASGSRRGLAIIVLLGLGLTVSLLTLGAWFWVRRSRPAAAAEKATQPAAAPALVAFACAECGKNLKAKASLAGKKVKCPQCSRAVLVPAAGADEERRSSAYFDPSRRKGE